MNIYDDNFFYQETAEPIVDSILMLLSQGIQSFESYEQWLYDAPLSSEEENYQHFNWRFSVLRTNDAPEWNYDIIGFAGRDCFDEPSVEVGIILPKGKHQKKIKIKRAELFDVVSHEILHLAQNIENSVFHRNKKEKGKLSYFLDPFEIEAFHVGIRAQSKLANLKFEDVARSYLRRSWPEGDCHDIDRVVTAWKDTKFEAFQSNLKYSL